MGIHGWGGRNRPSLLETALNLLFPPRCVTCGTDGVWLCPACLDQVLFYEKPWPAFVADLWPMQGVRSAAHLSGPLRDALHHFKYGGLRALAGVLGEMLWDNWETDPWPAQVIVPVPLHRERLRERGYNQSVLLARELGRHTGLPVAEQTLRRVLATPPQVGLGAAERAENVRHAFACGDQALAGQGILLVDDVLTTGATLRACAEALHQSGAVAVWGLTVAHD